MWPHTATEVIEIADPGLRVKWHGAKAAHTVRSMVVGLLSRREAEAASVFVVVTVINRGDDFLGGYIVRRHLNNTAIDGCGNATVAGRHSVRVQ